MLITGRDPCRAVRAHIRAAPWRFLLSFVLSPGLSSGSRERARKKPECFKFAAGWARFRGRGAMPALAVLPVFPAAHASLSRLLA